VNTVPEATLNALAKHAELGTPALSRDDQGEALLAEFAKRGVDLDALAGELQDQGAAAFVKSWDDLLTVISSKSALLGTQTSEVRP
jgi:transaldolase